MEQSKNQPPSWAMALLHFIVKVEFREEIEGDLLEKYQSDRQRYGQKVARRRFYAQLFSILKFNFSVNLNYCDMKPYNWSLLLLITLAIMVASVAPFFTGPGNDFSHNVSQFAQTIGYIGLPFVPFGLIWLIVEFRNKKGKKLNRWTNGYYPAWLVLIPVFLLLFLQSVMSIHEARYSDIFPLAIFIATVLVFLIYRIQKLKSKTDYKFNPIPMYIVLIPLLAILNSRFLVEKAAALSREKMIAQSELLIAAIREYKTDRGDYPEKLEDLKGKYISEIPKFRMMGVRSYQYEKRNGSFQLSFEKLWHWNATEVVVYNSLGYNDIKGNYEYYPTNYTNWSYYLAD